jgi:endonuclease G
MGTVAAPGSTSALAEQLRELEQRQQDLAAGRARDRADERAPALGGLDGDDIAAVNDPLRVARRLDRVSRYLTGRDPDSVPSDAPPAALVADAAARLALPQAPEVLLERVINQPDFLAVRYLEGGHVAQRTVGRIVIRGADGKVAGYGTGFLVSAHLLLTNHHVLPSAQVAAASVLELDFQRSLAGSPLPVVELALAPDRFFVADPTLDFALVEVAGAPESTAPFGWCRLTDAQGTVVVGECVTIVQHPRGREKEVVLRGNTLVDIPEQVLHYLTDTEPGSSGSPVFNDQWEVIALHHASVPGTTQGASPGYLNEGIRISRILRHLREAGLDGERRARVEALGTAPSPHGGRPSAGGRGVAEHDGAGPVVPGPSLQSVTAAPAPDAPDAPAPVTPVTVDIPLRLTLSLTLGDAAPAAPPPAQVTPRAQDGLVQPRVTVEALAIDPDYSTRGGYDPAFLGVPLPLPGVGSNAAVASAELRYHHFSVVMHRARRLALLAAVNIDGGATDAQPRSDDRWILDPRLPRSEQTGADVYADNDLDRGHLVRRLDPAWGPLARAGTTTPSTTRTPRRSTTRSTRARRSGSAWRSTSSARRGATGCG